ncbi:MAG: RICIN domain-containing protein, partial [Acidimicrobiales bacterium]
MHDRARRSRLLLAGVAFIALCLIGAGLPAAAQPATIERSDEAKPKPDPERTKGLPTPDIDYRLTSGWEPKTSYLNRAGSNDKPGNRVWLAELNQRTQTWGSMKWRFEVAPDGLYRIVNQWGPDSGYLTRSRYDGKASKRVTFRALDEKDKAQLWRLEPLPGNRIRIASGPKDNRYLHRHGIRQKDGTYLPSRRVRLSPRNNNGSMIWTFSPVDDMPPREFPELIPDPDEVQPVTYREDAAPPLVRQPPVSAEAPDPAAAAVAASTPASVVTGTEEEPATMLDPALASSVSPLALALLLESRDGPDDRAVRIDLDTIRSRANQTVTSRLDLDLHRGCTLDDLGLHCDERSDLDAVVDHQDGVLR